MHSSVSEKEVLEACRVLFGRQVSVSHDFLLYLQPSGAKSAYRSKAKETHPDLFRGEDPRLLQARTESFGEVARAYELVSAFLRDRERRPIFSPAEGQRAAATESARRSHRTSSPPLFVPARELEIGLYLYHRRIVTLRLLTEALVWQRRQRPSLGEVARRWGWLDDKGTALICASRIPFVRFGEKAIRLGLLTPAQVRTLLFYQRSRQQRLGWYFIERGIVSEQQMRSLVDELRRHNEQVSQPRR